MQYEQEKINADCIIPAAGFSARMGQWKLGLPYQQTTIIQTSVANALAVCSRVILVAGFQAAALQRLFHSYDERLEIIVNSEFTQGLFSSIQCGVAAVQHAHFFIAHGDMPGIEPAIFQQLWQHRCDSDVIFPGSHVLSGHPVLINSRLNARILQAAATTSMKSLLINYSPTYLNLTASGIYLDVDTPAAYQQLLQRD